MNLNTVTKNNLKISQQVLTLLVRLHLLLGAFFVFFGTHFTGLLLRLLYSSDKATPEASFVLRVYCIYVPVMGVNGILEAFFQGVGDAAAIRRQSRFLIIFWAIFVGTFYGCYKGFRFGISGLVIANIVNLWLRIEFAIRYARTYFGQDHKFSVAALSWNALFPQSILQWTGLLGSWGVLWVTQSLLSPWAHLGLGMGLGLVMLGIV